MDSVVRILAIGALFFILGKAADIVVVNVRKLGERFGVRLFFLGIILGLLTSLPELSIAINAAAYDVTPLSYGNLLGGIIVLFGLIMGGSIVVNRKISTDGKTESIAPIALFLCLPLLMSLDGSIGFLEGVILIVAYFILVFFLHQDSSRETAVFHVHITSAKLAKTIFLTAGGIAIVIASASILMRLSQTLLERYAVPAFIVGTLVFAIGTNLPEIMVTFRSWKRHIKELSLSNLIGSALANVFIIGILASIKTIPVSIDAAYVSLIAIVVLLLAVFLRFYRTGKELTRREGLVLIVMYLVFVGHQLAITALAR